MTNSLYTSDFEHDACGVGMVVDLQRQVSHSIVADALTILENLEHRGATGADRDSGDGAGILLDMPDSWLREIAGECSVTLPAKGSYGVMLWFLGDSDTTELRSTIAAEAVELGLSSLWWRQIPTKNAALGPTARNSEPEQWMQVVVEESGARGRLDLLLYRLRRRCTKIVGDHRRLYAASSSATTLIFKGMLTSSQLRDYFPDLRDERLQSSIALVHSRFSTNTFPSWPLAQPFRYIAHNGEINTIRSNRNWMRARESLLSAPGLEGVMEDVLPVLTADMSDSGSFDEVVELLTLSGRSLPHSVLMLIPEAWERAATMEEGRRNFYRYHSSLMEPWDGPASVSFCDGNVVGAVLDRNGLRPARYWETKDGRVIFSSEVGVLPLAPEDILRKGRLQPGRMFLVDLSKGRIVNDEELKHDLASASPYGDWLADNQLSLDELPERTMLVPEHESVLKLQRLFGYHQEDLRLILTPMAKTGEEPIGSMGSDTPIAAMSSHNQSFFNYFSQQFAQVTNPPLDAIREELVTSTRISIGPQGNLLDEDPRHARQIVLSSPVLSREELGKLMYVHDSGVAHGFKTSAFDALMDVPDDDEAPEKLLSAALSRLCAKVLADVAAGVNIVIISDRNASAQLAPIPSLLATAAVHQRLVDARLRTQVSLIVEAADVREVHHVAVLLGFGASAVSPYLAYDSIDDMWKVAGHNARECSHARYLYAKALIKGVTKVMSKMGVSTVASYVGSQLFEAVGLSQEVVDEYFAGVASRVGGVGLDRIARDVLDRHRQAFEGGDGTGELANAGEYQWRRDGEVHLFNPQTVFKLQHATRAKRYDIFRDYSNTVNEQIQGGSAIRGVFDFIASPTPLTLEDVEPVSDICRRFATGAMSYGSISAEAHETLAIAMNRLGGKSNTGEGGEDEERYDTSDPHNNRRSSVKQVASGRFGVTSQYLVNADDIQIKVAQGAKPGEGGQLPGSKVYPWIAKTRHSTTGVGLISPPPHHDIYSIEDLAQLIFDLKNANDRARVHVKLVSEAGVGTVAAGVAKAYADVILISGYDGGTGAAPLTSLKHAGTPWEVGLAETHQTLAKNGLRSRVTLQVDGQLKTGRDVVIAAILGAEEFGFATAPLVVSGCVMMRVCQLDTCPVGIATQNPILRSRFTGRPEFVETFFEYIAEEVREILAMLGLRGLEEAVGRTDLLTIVPERIPAHANFRFDRLLGDAIPGQMFKTQNQDRLTDDALDRDFVVGVMEAIASGSPYQGSFDITNVDRSTGTITGAEITRLHPHGVEPDTASLSFRGSAGQSFGAFIPRGLTLRLEGDANDYVGKGLSGGRIIISTPATATFESHLNVIAGNVIGYGATSGEIFLNGVVGERLGVRNSGATIVVEGVGDHACEYMTGGQVVILGDTGRNLGAGMSGGTLYLYDPRELLNGVLANGDFEIDFLDEESDAALHQLLHRYVEETGSQLAREILSAWNTERMRFVQVQSVEYAAAQRRNHG